MDKDSYLQREANSLQEHADQYVPGLLSGAWVPLGTQQDAQAEYRDLNRRAAERTPQPADTPRPA